MTSGAAVMRGVPSNQPGLDAAERLIVALNQPTVEEARDLVKRLDGVVSFFKIGLQLQLLYGVGDLVNYLIVNKKKVFLDYKYYDTEDTVREAVSRAAKMEITFLTIHGTGDIIAAAVAAKGSSRLKLLAVTVLTNLDAGDLMDLFGQPVPVGELVLHRAKKAIEHGCDGVVASMEEARDIRSLIGADRLLIATPGIRQRGGGLHDHKRAGTPTEAIGAGADYLIVGRPIINADDPLAAATSYIDEMQAAFDSSPRVISSQT